MSHSSNHATSQLAPLPPEGSGSSFGLSGRASVDLLHSLGNLLTKIGNTFRSHTLDLAQAVANPKEHITRKRNIGETKTTFRSKSTLILQDRIQPLGKA